MKRIELICACGEPWIHEKPKGQRGRNPRTNPNHPGCKKKRDAKKRAIRRAVARGEGVPEGHRPREGWKPPKPSGVTQEAMNQVREDSRAFHHWKVDRGCDALAATRCLLNTQGLTGSPSHDDHISLTSKDWERLRYIPTSKRREVKRWLSMADMPSQEYTGVSGPKNEESWSRYVIGSMLPWWAVEMPHPGTVQGGATKKLNPFAWDL